MANPNEQTKSIDPRDALEVYHVAGDVPDPLTGQMGHASTAKLDRMKREVMVNYQGRHIPNGDLGLVMTVDVYEVDGTTSVILLCPKCKHALRVTSDNKKVEFDKQCFVEHGGRLSIERFQCSWETEPEGRRMDFGLSLCKWAGAIEDNVCRDA